MITLNDIEKLPFKIVFDRVSYGRHIWEIIFETKDFYFSFEYVTNQKITIECNKIIKPSKRDVLFYLLFVASSAELKFTDFCSAKNFRDDSRIALNNYKECLEVNLALKKFFSKQQLIEIKQLFENNAGLF